MKNRRKSKRVYLVLSTRVFEQGSSKPIGQLGNLTAEGAMIISEAPLVIGRVYRLHLDLSKAIFHTSHLDFEARCIWTKPEAIAPQFFKSGLEFVKINPKDLHVMEQIIQEYELHL
jgi:PilZ domain